MLIGDIPNIISPDSVKWTTWNRNPSASDAAHCACGTSGILSFTPTRGRARSQCHAELGKEYNSTIALPPGSVYESVSTGTAFRRKQCLCVPFGINYRRHELIPPQKITYAEDIGGMIAI